VASGNLTGAAGVQMNEIPFYARLHAGEQASVPAKIMLSPHTPAGDHDFELKVGSRTRPATAHVSEVVDLKIDPTQITLLVGAATSYTRTLTATNQGNVALLTGAQCDAPIFDSYDLVSAFLMGLHKSDRKSIDDMVRSFLSQWADLQVGTLITKRPAMTIQPGQQVSVDVEFQVPANLKPLRHYRASLQLYNATVEVDIYTSGRAGQ
jgi:hypothetical protein